MAEKGLPLHEAIIKYNEVIQQKAQAAQQAGDTGPAMTIPEEAPPEEEELPGIPPSVLAGV
jgi:hypothetical protein